MGKLRCVDTKFWDDTYVIGLTPQQKLLFLYFLTNPLTDICGVYEVTLKRITFDVGINEENVTKILEKFEKDDRICYFEGWIIIKNFQKHQTMNESIRTGIINSFSKLPPNVLNKFKTVGGQTATRGGTAPEDIIKYKDNIKIIKEKYAQLINSKSKLTESAKTKIKTRLKTYKVDELLIAMKKFSNEPWWMKNNAHRGIAWFFHSDDRIDGFLNLEGKKDPLLYE